MVAYCYGTKEFDEKGHSASHNARDIIKHIEMLESKELAFIVDLLAGK